MLVLTTYSLLLIDTQDTGKRTQLSCLGVPDWLNEIKYKMKMQWFKVRSKIDLEPAYSKYTSCKQIQPLSRMQTLNGPRVRGISPVGKEKVYGGNDLPKSQVLSSEWKIERVREDASGDRIKMVKKMTMNYHVW